MRQTLALAAAVAAVLVAGEASAHARLLKSQPMAGATVPAPKVLRLSYSESIVPGASSVTVVDATKAPVATGPIALDPKNKRLVLVPVKGVLAPGAYHVDWKMKTEDGHTTDGAFDFKVK